MDKGSIKVLGGEPGDRALGLPGALVGFMPQTTRLKMIITIMSDIFFLPAFLWSSLYQRHLPTLAGFLVFHKRESTDEGVFLSDPGLLVRSMCLVVSNKLSELRCVKLY